MQQGQQIVRDILNRIILLEQKDKKGIVLRLLHEEEAHVVHVEVSYQSIVVGSERHVKEQSFPANRWGIQIADSVRAVNLAVTMAAELECELFL